MVTRDLNDVEYRRGLNSIKELQSENGWYMRRIMGGVYILRKARQASKYHFTFGCFSRHSEITGRVIKVTQRRHN